MTDLRDITGLEEYRAAKLALHCPACGEKLPAVRELCTCSSPVCWECHAAEDHPPSSQLEPEEPPPPDESDPYGWSADRLADIAEAQADRRWA